MATGRTFHCYLNPERIVPADALAVHRLSEEFLANKPLFGAVADEFLAFVDDAPVLAQNASFDIAFLNAELKRAAKPPSVTERVVDTLVLLCLMTVTDSGNWGGCLGDQT